MISFVSCNRLAQFALLPVFPYSLDGFLQSSIVLMAPAGDRYCRVLTAKVGNKPTTRANTRMGVVVKKHIVKKETRSLKPLAKDPPSVVPKKMERMLPVKGPKKVVSATPRRSVQAHSVAVLDPEVGHLARSNKLTRLETKSVSVESRNQYQWYLDKFKAFCVENGESWPPAKGQVDLILADYMDFLYASGKSSHEGEKLLAALEFRYVQFKNMTPRSKRALKGWRKAAPPSSRLPLPRLLMVGMTMQMLAEGLTDMALLMLVAFDLYLRPGEAIELCQRHVVPPVKVAGRQYSAVHVVIRDQEGLKPDKTGTFDNSLPFDKPATKWVGQLLLQKSKALPRKDARVFKFKLEEFRKAFARAGEAFNIPGLHPYQMRHGGATEDLTSKIRDFQGVKTRGRWRTDQSVRRYAKVGRVQQLLSKVSARNLQYCQWADRMLEKVFKGQQAAKKVSQ